MPCTNCGEVESTVEYTLRFTPGGREPKVLELWLCDGCLDELLADADIELLEPAITVSGNDRRAEERLVDRR